MSKFNYRKAEADLQDAGARHPEEIYEYLSEKALRGFMREHGLKPDQYFAPEPKAQGPGATAPGPEDGGCYLTTACVRARGLADDCADLETLRAFRDGYLARTEDGRREIAQYYAFAPEIVAAIERLPDSAEIWERLYADLVAPCVGMIRRGENERAHRRYRECALRLRDAYCPRRF